MKEYSNLSLEEFESDYWEALPQYPTELVKNIYELRKKPVNELDNNALRLLISQNVGLKYLLPKAINILKRNVLEEAIYYPGDLLFTVLTIEKAYWVKNKSQKEQLVRLLESSTNKILGSTISDEIKNELNNAIENFK